MSNTAIDCRMKNYYEKRADYALTRRTPVIIRIDGRAFHTFTKNITKPYDKIFHEAMNNTMQYLCKEIQGAKFGYTQSDEISILVIDYDTLETDAWFDYRIQKMCSIAASMATMRFNQVFRENVANYSQGRVMDDYIKSLCLARNKGAMFDARCFNIPEEEVANYFISRQQDATRNALQMLGQTYFSHKDLNHKSGKDIQEMLHEKEGINFNDMSTEFKRGVGARKLNDWKIDSDIPIFTQDRDYIEDTFRKAAD